jgi:putative ATP-dependent endonuclease of OLD family
MNIILGGGDAGKTTILEALALLLSPSNTIVLAEADYWKRNVEAEFAIRAVMSLPASSDINRQQKFSWPWEWDGADAVAPKSSDEGEDLVPADPVYCLQVRGTSELEVSWEIIQPNDEVDVLSASVRRQIGLVRMGGDDRNDRDLRLVYGSALDRLLADKNLRAKIGQRLSEVNFKDNLGEESCKALKALDEILKKESLPHNLELGLTSSQGLSIGALTGLFAKHSEDVSLPLTSWGAGTRRMTTLQIAAATESTTRLTVVDEIERGLEPYRLRKLVSKLQTEPAQSFVTTHSPFAIGAGNAASLWFLDSAGNIGSLPRDKIGNLQDRNPLIFLSRFAIICEGITEIGFVHRLLQRAVEGDFRDCGIHLADGGGNEATLAVLETMASARLEFAGFADNEGNYPTRWASLKTAMNDRLLRWDAGCLEENIISHVGGEQLIELAKDVTGAFDGYRLRSLADRLGTAEKNWPTLTAAADAQGTTLRDVIIAAAIGSNDGAPGERAKEWKSHAKKWFKTFSGGCELADRMFALGLWPTLKPTLLPFLNTVRVAVGQVALQDLSDE